MYHMRGSDGVRPMMEREWGHRWLLQAWDNLAANFWPELNTNAQTQHATAAGERTNAQHSPALVQLFKTNKKIYVQVCLTLLGWGVGQKKENNVKNNPTTTLCCGLDVATDVGVTGLFVERLDTLRVFSLVRSRSGYDRMYEGVKGRLCVWKHIDCLPVCLSACLTLAQQWQTYPPRQSYSPI